MKKIYLACLFLVGIINFLPVIGVISAAQISRAYSIELPDYDTVILMRHRALLFGILGGFVLYSVFVPRFQVAAMLMAAVSMLGFLVIMCLVGGYNDSILKIAIIDIVGIAGLILAVIIKYFARPA